MAINQLTERRYMVLLSDAGLSACRTAMALASMEFKKKSVDPDVVKAINSAKSELGEVVKATPSDAAEFHLSRKEPV